MSLDKLVENNKILTFVGTGGVGKTTLSIAASIYGASRGLRVAVITIDPSKRLARVLGLENDSYKSLDWEIFNHPMDVFFLDTTKVFNDFVKKSLSEPMFERIIKNRIYQQISKNLRETHNFAAIYKLNEILSNKNYDLIILDTPPSHQVIEFFESPTNLQKFFTKKDDKKNSSVMNWVQNKGLAVVEGLLTKITGKEFVEEVESFFSYVGKLREDIFNVSQSFIDNMRSPESQLVLVGSPALDKMEEVSHLQKKIQEQGYAIEWCIVNRSYPDELDLSKEPSLSKGSQEEDLYKYFSEQKQKSLKSVEKLKRDGAFSETAFVMMPEFVVNSDSKESLIELSKQVNKNWFEQEVL